MGKEIVLYRVMSFAGLLFSSYRGLAKLQASEVLSCPRLWAGLLEVGNWFHLSCRGNATPAPASMRTKVHMHPVLRRTEKEGQLLMTLLSRLLGISVGVQELQVVHLSV